MKIKYLILATKTTADDKINQFKKEIPSITNLAITTTLNTIINKVKNKISNITNLSTTTALTAVENKTPNLSNLKMKFNLKC